MAAKATPKAIPNYVLAFPHPGLYVKQSITTHGTEIAADVEMVYARILIESLSRGGTETEIKLRASETLKLHLMIPYDADIRKAKLCDREHHGLMWERISTFTSIPLKRMTKDHWKALISTLRNPDREERPVTVEGYRTTGVFILKHPSAHNFCLPKDFIKYLEETDKDSIPLYLDLIKKLPKPTDGLHPLTTAFHTPGLLSEEEKAFINKHMECPPPGHEIPDFMDHFIGQLIEKIAAGEDPIAIAAFAHMQMAIIHPFCDGNGRAARALTNFILIQAGFDPVVFISEKYYMRSVETARQTPEVFYTFLKERVEEFAALKTKGTGSTLDDKVEYLFDSYLKAKELNGKWTRIPLATRRELFKALALRA